MELSSLNILGLATSCQEQSNRYFAQQTFNPRYCYELFRRAILQRDDEAWAAVYRQYTPLVKSWIIKNSLWATVQSRTELDEAINRIFAKMWRCITAEKFEKFNDLAALLRYLQMCVHSELVDIHRVEARYKVEDRPAATDDDDDNRDEYDQRQTAVSAEQEATASDSRQQVWRLISERLNNEKEQRVVYGMFVLAQKPKQVQSQYPHLFPSAKDVSRTKENLIMRLRRDPDLLNLLRHA